MNTLSLCVRTHLNAFMLSMVKVGNTRFLNLYLNSERAITDATEVPGVAPAGFPRVGRKLTGLAETIEEFDAGKIYELIEIVAGIVPASDVAKVMARKNPGVSFEQFRSPQVIESGRLPQATWFIARLRYSPQNTCPVSGRRQ